MAELKLPRLLAAAKEFNVGQDTIIDFLEGKGFSKDDLKPTSKLTEEMYRSLQQEFQSDKVAKLKSDQIDLPKGSSETRKRKEEEEVVFRKEQVVKKVEKPEPEEKPQEPVKEEAAVPTPAPEPEPPVEAAPQPEVKESKEAEREIVKLEAPEIEGPKILDKIDLSAIDSSTRPKKTVKKKAEKEKPAAQPEEAPAAKKTAAEMPVQEAAPEPVAEEQKQEPVAEKPAEVLAEPKVEEELPPVIENIRAEKLEGPKILGKIELPRPGEVKPREAGEEKRKRKRIPIEKKETTGGGRPQIEKAGARRGPIVEKRGSGGGPQGGRGRGRHQPREVKEIDEKEIQDKIRETQAKLAGAGGRGKSLKAKYRREKRQEMAEQAGAEDMQDNKLQLTEFISVSELASLMDVNFTDVISKCMGLGLMVSINQRLDAEVIELVAGEFGFDVEFIDMEQQMEMEEQEEVDAEEDLEPRAPIVTIMGHVDHGKTSLLDYIRNANVIAGEAGGITQHIGAYEVTLANGKKIAFLDTPGHEAFTAMRARGAKVTDIAVIVIAADDAVMPQTREAISHAQAAGVPMIFAINKIDKDGANPQKIYEQLSQMNLLVEEWGGKYQNQELSAKQGVGVDQLLEKILLEAELLDLKANPNREASGTIIEASLDKGRGYVATVLVQNGTLKIGDIVVSGQFYGRVKAMFNERNKKADDAPPSTPALILGLNGAPQAGEKFRVILDESEAKGIANRRAQILREQGIRTRKHITLDEIGRRLALGNFKELNLIIKGDVDGSVEALTDSLQKLSTEEIVVSVVHKGVGQITESDVLLATASDAIVVGFNVRPSPQAARLADQEGVQIKLYSIIYNAIEEIKSAMEGMLEPTVEEKIVANAEVRNVFRFDKATVAGCYVLEGKIQRNAKIRVIRDGIVEYPKGEGQAAELQSLKRFKDDVKEVPAGMECGLTVKNFNDLREGDIVEAFELEEVKRTL
ncbi:MAG TPA: translation initiation factor IF-2 [Chitinophagaceae bacterium]|jgi:translation initiation factor IF-2|nr:translation initiation factor IF-2 [Chitinophagaceae bacterium]